MVEFQEVAQHWKRMCKRYWTATSCHGCPIAEYEHGYEACSAYEADVTKMEELVMSWAAEHPEPVYTKWYDYLSGLMTKPPFPVDDHEFVKWLDEHNIPADIAQKLGIEPKEG